MPRLDPEIAKIVQEAGLRVNPFGFKNLPGYPAAFYNPYIWFGYAALVLAAGGFVCWQMRSVLWAALLVGGILAAAGIWMIVFSARRIPAWHRARRAVRAHVKATGAEFPPDLRWYG